jgi:type II secretory pathway pseudopilin PulG
MTLIELLVVIIIITTLVSAAIPIMSPTNDDRRLREASRAVNSFISTAQASAIAIQRPFGVAIKRLSKETHKTDDNGVSIELYYVEQPSPFVGFNEQSKARVALYSPSPNSLYGGLKNLVVIQFVAPGTSNLPASDGLPAGWDADQFAPGVIRPGDVIVINGTHYKLLSDTNDNSGGFNVNPQFVNPQFDPRNLFFANNTGYWQSRGVVQIVGQPINDSGQMVNAKYDNRGNELGAVTSPEQPYWTDPAPYRILRQPMKTSAEPLQLPEGSAIDLRASGLGDTSYFYIGPTTADSRGVNNSDDILIMFAPEGRVSRLSLNANGLPPLDKLPYDQPIVDNIFLLVGKRENAPPPAVGSDPTLKSATFTTLPVPTELQVRDMKKPVNWLRGESRWIVIGSQSGRVVTIENSFVDPSAVITTYTASPYSLSQSTEQMRSAQILTAREFIKEMKQLGGR